MVAAADEPERLLEPAMFRPKLGRRPRCDLPIQPVAYPDFSEKLWQQFLRQRQPFAVIVRVVVRIVLVPETSLIPARHQAGTRWAASTI